MKKFEVYLDIFGFDKNPEELARELNLAEVSLQYIGRIPEGYRRPAKENSITLYSKRKEDESLNIHIKDILNRLPDSKEMADILPKNSNLTMRVVVCIEDGQTSPSAAMFIEKSTMNQLSSFNCEMDFDIYG